MLIYYISNNIRNHSKTIHIVIYLKLLVKMTVVLLLAYRLMAMIRLVGIWGLWNSILIKLLIKTNSKQYLRN